MRFSLRHKKEKEELVLLFDIGSSSVGAAFFLMHKERVPKIVFSEREQVKVENEVSVDNFLSNTMKALKIVASKTCFAGMSHPDKVFCVVSSPWFASETRTIDFSKEESFEVTEKLINSLVEKETNIFQDEYLVKGAHALNKIRPIEVKTMKTVLNGYESHNPIGEKVKKLKMSIFLSIGQEKFLKNIESIIHQHFPNKDIEFISFSVASFAVARDMFISKENFLLINIGGEITDISMVKQDIIKESMSFPAGRNFMIRGVAKGLNKGLDEARSLLSLYKDGHMEDSHIKNMEPIVSELRSVWLKMFQDSLSVLSSDISIPSTIFITVDQELVDFFSDIIRTEQFSQYTLTESKFRVIFLGTKALHGIALFEESVKRDPFLIIESIYINNFLK